MNSENREIHKNDSTGGYHPLGSDRLLLASVGTTPGLGATFVSIQGRGHRQRSARRSLRALITRGRQDHRHTTSHFADTPDFNAFMGRPIGSTTASEQHPND